MLVGDRMTKPVLTIDSDVPVQDALAQMRKEHIRRFPVINKTGKLIGIVSESDLLNASPSEATTLSVWEINYLLSKITVERVMTKDVITVTEDTPIEEAARIMADKKIGALPVMRGGSMVGIITETNLFRIFLELLGARERGVRVSVLVKNIPGKFAELSGAVRDAGGNILAFVTFTGDSPEVGRVTMKVQGVELDKLRKAVSPVVERIVDIR